MTTLEQSFADICTKHDLLNVSVSHSPATSRFVVMFQWSEGEGRGCVHGSGKDISEAFSEAVGVMEAKRNPLASPFADVPLITETAA